MSFASMFRAVSSLPPALPRTGPASSRFFSVRAPPRSSPSQTYPVLQLFHSPQTPRPPRRGSHLSLTSLHLSSILSTSPASSSAIHIRDLLTLSIRPSSADASSLSDAPAILPRGAALLVNFGHVKAIAWRESAVLFAPDEPGVALLGSQLDGALTELAKARPKEAAEGKGPGKLPSTASSFELVFLEAVLRDVCDTWSRRVRLFVPVVDGVLSTVSSDGGAESGVHRLIPLKVRGQRGRT